MYECHGRFTSKQTSVYMRTYSSTLLKCAYTYTESDQVVIQTRCIIALWQYVCTRLNM